MNGCFIKFKDSNKSFFVSGESFSDIKNKLKDYFEKEAQKENDTIGYFNWMTIDSDFVRDYDAELTIEFCAIDGGLERMCHYQFDFEWVDETL